ncbi:glycoside hydrolase family 99-like domain-containing protein [Microcoleus sp. N9_B2]|uniref:glycoside hydrolase family 99-like domain-containing protein n=1 Tax=unclassified Microcoleus TaxID=2642155 RepID=UPI002FD47EAC
MNNSLQVHEETASNYFHRGNLLKQSDKLEEAAAAYQRCTELNPDFSWYHHNLGEVLAKLGQWDGAEKSYRRACELNPNSAWSWHNLGEVLEQQGNLNEAVAAYRKAVEIYPDFYEFHNSLGKALCLQGQLDESVSCLRKAIELDSESALPYQNLWEALARQGRVDEGMDCLRRAIELNPGEADLYLKLAEALQGKNELTEAVGYYRKAIQLKPDFHWLYYKLGTALAAQGQWEEAIASYSKAAELEPGSAIVHHYLGHTLSIVQRWEEAIVSYRRALDIVPNAAVIYQHLGDALATLQKWVQAVGAYRKSVEFDPNSLEAQDHLGFALYQLGRYDEAISAYRKALILSPNSDVVNFHLGDALFSLQKWEEATASYRRTIELNPESSEVYQKLGNTLAQLHKWEESAASYQRAVEFNSQSDALYEHLGKALVQQNQHEGGIGFFKKALHIKIDNNFAHWQALGKVLQTREATNSKLLLEVLSPVTIKEPVSSTEHSSIELTKPSSLETDVRLIAYYLPQFHPIPENDLWWGKGFTEWTNVTKAQPLFEGHYQPHLPADLGFYDLRLPEVREAQAALAKKYGIYGFCYYYYWFAGKRLLNHPIDEVLRTKKPDFPFCICWANENWTRRWDGAEHEILMAQECWSDEQNQAFAESIIHILLDERYIRINGEPLLIVYRRDLFPNLRHTAEQWRKIFRKNGVGEVHLCIAITFRGLHTSLEQIGFDSAVQFPPHGFSAREISPDELRVDDFSGHLYDYKDGVINSLSQEFPNLKVFRSVMTSWDNTARRKRAAHAFINSHPDVYELWLRGIIEKTRQVNSGDEKLVFINAWNEWAEGAHLEPDHKYGYSYLLATRRALEGTHSWKTIIDILRYVPIKSVNHLHSQLDELDSRIDGMNRSIEAMNKLLQKTAIIIDVSRCQCSELLWQLDFPRPDTRVSVNSIDIKGWVISQNSPVVGVKVISNSRVLQQTPINISRPDVAEVHLFPGSENSGFSMTVQIAGMSSEAFLHLEALLEDGSCIPIEVIRLRQGYDPIQDLGISLEQQEMLGKAHADIAKTIINLIRALPMESVNHRYQLLDELENKIEVKELLLEAMNQVLKPISVQDFYQQV